MQLPIVIYGHPILRKKAQLIDTIDNSIGELIGNMKETLLAKNGLGLAAPQIGKSLALFITNVPVNEDDYKNNIPNIKVFINPKICSHSEESWIHEEGCFSLPKIYVPVPRPYSIVVEYQDENGLIINTTLSGWAARVFCHENDHINGVLSIDRTTPRERQKAEPYLKKMKDQYKEFNKQFS